MAIEDGKKLRDYGLQSERLLWPTKGPGVFEQEVEAMEQAVGLTTLEKAVAWAQTKSMWPDTFGLACCAIEMMSIVSARYDIARFGMEAFRSSPRQADLLIVSGRVVHKMAAPLRQVYDQMLEPKWVIAMGACASSGGMFNNYTTLQGVDKIVAVDVHVPGCLPRPEALMEGIVRLHEKVQAGIPPAYLAAWSEPAFGDTGIRHDLGKVTAGMNKRYTLAAVEALRHRAARTLPILVEDLFGHLALRLMRGCPP